MRAPNGEPARYFREVVMTYDGTDCLPWPYTRTPQGYGHMWEDGKHKLVHRRACEERHGPPPTPKHEAAHSCGNGHLACCAGNHLSWKTRTQNAADMAAHGTVLRGECHGQAKLTEADARDVLALKGSISQRQLARFFGVTNGTIAHIHTGRNWRGLQPSLEAEAQALAARIQEKKARMR